MRLGSLPPLVGAALRPCVLLAVTAGAAAAQTGAVTGRVTAQNGQPLPDTRVTIVGTALVTGAGADGRFAFRGVPAGPREVRVVRVGFAEQKQSVAVTAGGTATVGFVLQPVAVQLQEVVTTATGPQRRAEIGNAVTTVDAAKRTEAAPVTDLASLLNNQAPGVQVLPGNTTGTGARIRIRGTNSITLANDPIYIIDGVRMTSSNGSQSSNIFTGGAIQSRAQDVNPDDIATLEVVKGPSAATLYGTDAANGVVVITTKRGRAGGTNINVSTEGGIIRDQNTYPTAYTLFGHAPPGVTRNCATPSLTQVSAGLCVADSLSKYNLFADPAATPLGTGDRQNHTLQIGGGSTALRFFTSAAYEREDGVLKIPDFDVRRLDTLGVNIRNEWRTPNQLVRGTVRANIDAVLSPKFDAQFSTGYININSRLPQSDNNALGLLSNAFGGPGYATGRTSTLGFDLHGYRATTPAESFQDVSTQVINRFIGSTTANYRPTSWLTARADGGVDYASRVDQQLCRRGTCPDVGTTRLGFVQDDRANIRTVTGNGAATATFQPLGWLNSRTTAGAQWVRKSLDGNGARAENLTPGASTVAAGATQLTYAETDISKTFGLFVEEVVGIRDRLFLTAAVRSDQNSAFGTQFQRVYYPKASASYVISDEGWFRRPAFLDQLRLRSAYGSSGVQPEPNDALRYFLATQTNVGLVDQPGVFYQTLGNEQLRPERATEFEGGFDAKLFGGRGTFEVTYYSKLTKDALVGAVVAPSLGTRATAQRTNLGSVKNAGLEVGVNAQVVSRRAFTWDVGVNGSTNANKLLTLGADAQGNPLAPQVFSTYRNQPGYPLFGYWQRRITGYRDANNDGILTANEISVADSNTFIGYSQPRHVVALTNGFGLFNNQLRVNTLLDYKGGHKLLNGTQRIRCQSRNNCYEAYDRSAPLELQARAVAVREDPSRTQVGYMEDAAFVRFRELGVTYAVPQGVLARALRGKSATLSFAARNLHVWTNYTGLDPESNAVAGGANNLPSDFQTVPPPTYYILRLNVGF